MCRGSKFVTYYTEASLLFACLIVPLSGCGGSSASKSVTRVPGNTMVTVLATSTANDQLSQFDLSFNSISLTDESGNTASLLPAPEHAEFIHRNGSPEPLFTTTIPENTYVSAIAQIGPERIACMGTLLDGRNRSSIVDYGYTPDERVKIVIPQPLKISGSNMRLMFDLKVSQSATWSPSSCPTASTYSLTPTLELTSISSTQDVKMAGMTGLVSSVDPITESLVVTSGESAADGLDNNGAAKTWQAPKWTISLGKGTAYQGVSGLSSVQAGMPVSFDGVLQNDGSVIATRLQVADTETSKLSVFRGPLARVFNDQPVIMALGTEQYGDFRESATGGIFLGVVSFSYDNASFQISGGSAQFQQLPFVPTFDQLSMVAGQSISISWHDDDAQLASVYLPAATVTLVPQTIDGTVLSTSQEGSLKKYVVALAGYDLFPQLATEAFQTSPLNDPGTVVVYVGGNTANNTLQPITVGNLVRFTGLVFNDAGTLRMACSAVNAGVPE